MSEYSSRGTTSIKQNIARFFDTVTLKTFPKLSYVIVSCSLLVNLSEAGFMGLMAIYFQRLFQLEASQVTVALHTYNFLKYFAVLCGAVLADSYYGRVKLILYGQTIFFLGNTLLSISSTIRMAFPSRIVLFLSLAAKVIGPGFIMPCLIPLAADQIKEQNTTYTQMKAFFVFYFALLQVCDLFAKLFLPLVLEVSCFDLDSCYPLAFGIPAVLSCLSLVIFWIIKKRCFSITPHQPIVIQGLQCIWYALRMKFKKRKIEKRDHWLYFADDRYDMKFIEDIRCTLNVLFVPIPIYWSLYDQQFTSWTLQAARLNTEISPSFRFMPEQTQAFGPFFFLLFIPLFHFFIYDLVYPFRFLRTLLRRMVVGGFLIAMAFMMASNLELRIEFSYPSQPASDEAYIFVYNGLDSEISIVIENQKVTISPYGLYQFTAHVTEDLYKIHAAIIHHQDKKVTSQIVLKRTQSVTYAAVGPKPFEFLQIGKVTEGRVYKHDKGRVRLRHAKTNIGFPILPKMSFGFPIWTTNLVAKTNMYTLEKNATLRLYPESSSTWYIQKPILITMSGVVQVIDVKALSGSYEVYSEYNKTETKDIIKVGTGGVYTLMAYMKGNKPAIKQFEITPPNKINILWMIPQYVVLSISTVLFRISAFAFIYTETPDQMKSLAWSMCYMTLSTGNVITAIFGGSGEPSTNFLLFSLGMFVGMLLFIQSATSYKYTHKYHDKPVQRKSLLNIF